MLFFDLRQRTRTYTAHIQGIRSRALYRYSIQVLFLAIKTGANENKVFDYVNMPMVAMVLFDGFDVIFRLRV